jgi:hypothetical protein
MIKTRNQHQSSCVNIAIISYLRSDHTELAKVCAKLGEDHRRVIHKAALMGGYPPAKANMIRAAVRAGIRPGRVAKDFGVAVAMVRKLATT